MNIEPLESRIAPAALNGQVLSYTDIDGDKVAITFSEGTLDFNGNFIFSPPNGIGGEQLQTIDVHLVSDIDGANITMKVTRAGNGDGLANVGHIGAIGHLLGTVSIVGDLGDIDAGKSVTVADPPPGLGVKTLSVRSMGRFGAVTGGQLNGDSTLQSDIFGGLGTLKIKGDLIGAWLHVAGSGSATEDGTIGAVTVGGSLIGGNTERAGAINASGDIGAVKIGRDIIGGTFEAAGFLQSDSGKIASVTLGGSLFGGTATFTGEIRSGSDMGPVKIAGDVIGGSVQFTGYIGTDTGFGPDLGDIASITIGGSVIGGKGKDSGEIHSTLSIGDVKIGGNLQGGDGMNSGRVEAFVALGSVTIDGSILGGDGSQSGTIKNGMNGGDRKVGAVKIAHDVVGGTGPDSASLFFIGNAASVSVGGSVIGGDGARSGVINELLGNLGPVSIGGDLRGGAGDGSGRIESEFILANDGTITSVTIRGSLIGGSFDGADVAHTQSGGIQADKNLGPVKIGHDLIGGSVAGLATSEFSGYIASQYGRIASVWIGGSIVTGVDSSTKNQAGGDNPFNASIRAAQDIGSLVVKGSLIGHEDTGNGRSPVIIAAGGQANPTATQDLAIGSISIGGRVEQARIFAGYVGNFVTFGAPIDAKNGNAQIGKVTVGADWVASNLVAGIADTGGDGFGNGTEAVINPPANPAESIAKIASIVIKGGVFGTHLNTADHFGFTSHTIGSFKVAGFTAPLTAATAAQFFELSTTTATGTYPLGDVTLREI